MLRVQHLQKVFGDTVAFRDANLEVIGGEIHALLGENGAGKSTLIKILAGAYHADSGSVSIRDEDDTLAERSPHHLPIAFIHQDPVVFPDFSVAESIASLTSYPVTRGLIRWRDVRRRAHAVLARVNLEVDIKAPISSLPLATRTMVSIAAALANDATLLILDEPTASLAAPEVRTLFALLAELRNRGIAILLVTHRIDEVFEICDRVTVLRDGSTVRTELVSQLTEPQLVRLIVGTDASPEPIAVRPVRTRAERLRAEGLVGEGVPGPVSFTLREGEILGLTGTLESGHHRVGAILYGLVELSSGGCQLDGISYVPRSPRKALARGIRYLPADRNELGLAPNLDLRENLFLNPRGRVRPLAPSSWVTVGTDREGRAATGMLERFDVRPPQPRAELATLSGGNAQKLLLARSFVGTPILVILTEPSAGVDIGARSSIYEIIRKESAAGLASSLSPRTSPRSKRCATVVWSSAVVGWNVNSLGWI